MRRLSLVLAIAPIPVTAVNGPVGAAIRRAHVLTAAEVATIQQACETISFQYARYLDGKDWEHLPNVFAPDGVWEVLNNRMEGREAIGNYWKRRTADWAPTHGRVHQIANQVIEVIDRDHARGTSNAIVYFFDTAPGANKALIPSLIARNIDEYVRTPEGWKLKLRRVERVADVAQ